MDRTIITRSTQKYHIGNRACDAFWFINQIHIIYNKSVKITIGIETGEIYLFDHISSNILNTKVKELVVLENKSVDVTPILDDIIYLFDYMEYVILPKIADDLHSHFGKAIKSARNI